MRYIDEYSEKETLCPRETVNITVCPSSEPLRVTQRAKSGKRIPLEEQGNKVACRSNLSLKAYLVIKIGNENIDYLNNGVEGR